MDEKEEQLTREHYSEYTKEELIESCVSLTATADYYKYRWDHFEFCYNSRESLLQLIKNKLVDIPQLLKSDSAKGYNTYIRVVCYWVKEEYEKRALTKKEFERLHHYFTQEVKINEK